MSKPSVMRQDHGVAISFNASVTSGGGVIFFVGFTLYIRITRFRPNICALYIYNTIKYIIMK